jgi:outer membrane protein TolC
MKTGKKLPNQDIRILKGEMYPELKLTGGYIAAKIPGFFSVTNMLNVGVGVNYNISSFWKTKTKIRQAEAQMKQVTLSESILDDNIQMDINRNYYSLVSFRKKIEVYEKASEQANENYRIVKNKFDNSLATTTELLEADVSKLQAVLSYTLARADAFVAYHKLLQSTGTLSTEFLK